MSSKSFLSSAEIATARELLKKKDLNVIASYIDETLLRRLAQHRLWSQVRPYALGSWARGELCAKSDIDLILLGEEHVVQEFTQDFLAEGIKIRYRVPADRSDWSVGVLPFDVMALLSARPFFKEDESPLREQWALIQKRGLRYKKTLLKAMHKERAERAKRYDSISNYLEPNLKYGPGGLRDLEQGLMIFQLFVTDKLKEASANIEKLTQLKAELLFIRHWLHLNGGGDVLTSNAQGDLAQFLGFESVQKLMSKVQFQLGEVSFYADWMADFVKHSAAQIKKMHTINIESISTAFKVLDGDSSPTTQELVRKKIKTIRALASKEDRQAITNYLNAKMSDEALQAYFRSHLLELVIPSLKRLRGHVQHDQYHRFSVDAHTLQAARGVLRAKAKPTRLGRLSKWAKNLTSNEWEILFWSALYHDLGKGLLKDHSLEGEQIVNEELPQFQFNEAFVENVSWMVRNHLILSSAAFRQNPLAQSTWTELFKRGVQGSKIVWLTLFTAIDIQATNPDAWNDWKESLLAQLCEALLSPEAFQIQNLLKQSGRLKIKVDKAFNEGLDPVVFEGVSPKHLLTDYARLQKAKVDLEPLVIKNRKKEIWIRQHSKVDRPGLFLTFAHQLHDQGLSVQQAFAMTHPEWGAYDWFKVKSTKSPAAIKTFLHKAREQSRIENSLSKVNHQNINFSVIEIVSQDKDTAVISFRGQDQRGALLAALKLIYEAGLEIQAAKVHTWGRQIDDVFTVKNNSEALTSLKLKRSPGADLR